MKEHKYKIGDDIYCEFEPAKVARLNSDGGVSEVNYGHGTLSGCSLNDTVRPATPEVATISKQFTAYKKRVRAAEGRMNLNWPDIHRHLVDLWWDACYRNSSGYKSLFDATVESAEHFVNDLCAEIERARLLRVQGIPLLRP